MGNLQSFEQFLTTQSIQVPVWGFIFNLLLAAILAFMVSKFYIKYGRSLSNRRVFANNFVLLTVTTMLIISIVKSSLALSLGLVGALSIVRFRAAIKEPEELTYLFLCIAVGLGLGADQRVITIVAVAIIFGIIWAGHFSYKSADNQNLLITIATHNPHKIELEQIVNILKKYCTAVNLKRFDENGKVLEATFLVEFENFELIQKAKSVLQENNEAIEITFLDNKGIM